MRRSIALTLALIIFFSTVHPSVAWALTSGPAQPEFATFTPFEQTSLVDNFTGDFKYNIPLMDVDGYPINLAYESGVSLESEASWVGLGWNLNPGSINRSIRGLPDDFNGDNDRVKTTTSMRPRRVYEAQITAKPTAELLGFNIGSGKGRKSKKPGKITGRGSIPSATIGITFDNYYGLGFKQSLPLNTNLELGRAKANIPLNLSYATSNGYNLSADLSLTSREATLNEMIKGIHPKSINLGASWNNQQGFTNLQYGQDIIFRKNPLSHANIPFGSRSYSPDLQNNKHSLSLGADFGYGVELFWMAGKVNLSGNYSVERIKENVKVSLAYGYMYSGNANNRDEDVITDYNRESDALVSKELPLLPTAHATFDYYSVSGQGIGGSYRPHQGQAIAIYDPPAEHKSEGYDIGLELGALNVFKGATNIATNFSLNRSGAWSETGDKFGLIGQVAPYTARSAEAFRAFRAVKSATASDNYEPVAFKKAGELNEADKEYFNRFHGTYPVAFGYDWTGEFTNKLVYADNQGNRYTDQNGVVNGRNARITRTETFDQLTAEQASVAGFDKTINLVQRTSDLKHFIPGAVEDRVNSVRHANHISEIKVTRADGFKFYYGIPVYQLSKIEMSCAVNSQVSSEQRNAQKINYTTGGDHPEMGTKNKAGTDYYYKKTETTAHATSYLLTAMVSPDYSDVDNNGPSANDVGTYVKFNYQRTHDANKPYRYRTPYEQNTGNLSEGNYSDPKDNKAVVTYGTREVYYLSQMVTKNYVAEFYTSERDDAIGVLDENGGRQPQSDPKLHKLDSIRLFAITDYKNNPVTAVPIKTVHFRYNYNLCKGVPNSINPSTGKLTLSKVFFTYRNSAKGALNPYTFSYNEVAYKANAQDMWGNYATPRESSDLNGSLSNSEFPFVIQNEDQANLNAGSWLLKRITMPTGGSINVDYESDSYAFVQDKRAMVMTAIKGFSNELLTNGEFGGAELFKGNKPNNYLYFTIPTGISEEDFKHAYTDDIEDLYFKCYIDLTGRGHNEFVSGFATFESSGIASSGIGYIKMKDVDTEKPRAGAPASPISKLAWQQTRLQLNQLINPAVDIPESFQKVLELIKNQIRKIQALATGVNASLRDFGYGKKVNLGRSFVRLNAPTLKKLGGGSRVKKLTFNDNWQEMAGLDYTEGTYGYEYNYETDHSVFGTISSGVASWEPAHGGEENPHRLPLAYSIDHILAPNENLVRELPAGEALYPNGDVGYSKITVKETRTNPRSKGVGRSVYEFYTAKDFPIQNHILQPLIKPENQLIAKLLSNFKQYTTTKLYSSQGLSLEFSNMHGVAKSEKIYAEGAEDNNPMSKTEYFYKSRQVGTTSYGDPTFCLTNECEVMRPDGSITSAMLGVDFDVNGDFREFRSADEMEKAQLNLDVSGIFPFIIPAFTAWPAVNLHRSILRTSNILKTTTRTPILDHVVKTDLSSTVTEYSLVYDAQTGGSLITSLQNQFNDTYYKTSIPAYWAYPEMGASYLRTGNKIVDFNVGSGGIIPGSIGLKAGDVILSDGAKYWVIKDPSLKLVDQAGNPVSGPKTDVTLIQTGNRNQLNGAMLTVSSRKKPVNGNKLNFIDKDIIDAGGLEYTSESLSDCACSKNLQNNNPYTNGDNTAYQPVTSYKYLTGRKYTGNDIRNVNPRVDGAYAGTFSALWQYNPVIAKWTFVPNGWVPESKVSIRNQNNSELESKDAIDQYKAMRYTYNQKIPKSMAANARYKQIMFEHFEEDADPKASDESNCMDTVMYFRSNLSGDKAHTGKQSVKVGPKNNVSTKINLVCPQ